MPYDDDYPFLEYVNNNKNKAYTHLNANGLDKYDKLQGYSKFIISSPSINITFISVNSFGSYSSHHFKFIYLENTLGNKLSSLTFSNSEYSNHVQTVYKIAEIN